VLAWAAVSVLGPTVAGDPITPLSGGSAALTLVAIAALLSLAALAALRYRERRMEATSERLVVATPRLERIS
jgi:hypothetical protein